MKFLCDPLDVVKAFGISQAQQTTADNAKPAVSIATRALCSVLDTEFAYSSQTDFFDSPWNSTTTSIYARLLLKNRFVDSDVPLTVRYSINGLPLTAAGSGEVLSTDYYIVDRNLGVVTILYPNPYVGSGKPNALSVTYSSGLAEDNSGIFVDVPEWLYDAALALSVYTLKTLPINTAQRATNKGQRIGLAEKETLQYASMLYSANMRPRAGMLFPSMTLEA